GRVGPGVCARLYAEEDFLKRDEFTPPEIQRSSLAGVILQMDALGLGKIEEFPFLEPPSNALIKSGYDELAELGGIDENRAVTAVGRQLAVLPLGPRCGRMLLAGAQYGVLEDALTVVAALETADPRLRPLEQKEAADARHKQYQDAFSDFRSFLHLWKKVEQERATLSGNKFHQFCRKEFLSWMRLREWREVRAQLAELVAEHKFADLPPAGPAPVLSKNRKTALPEERLHQALLSGLLGKVGAWHEDDKIYRGARGSAFHLWPGSGLSGTHPAWVMAAEVVETSRVFARTVAAVQPEWIERQAAHLLKLSYADPFFDAEFGCVRAYMSATLFGLPLIVRRKALFAPVDPEKAREIFIADGLVGGLARCNLDFYRHNLALVETVREREEKLRRRGLVVSAEGLAEFYRSRLPRDICDVSALERWVLAEKKAGRAPLTMSEADVVVESVSGLSADLFPPAWRRQKFNLALTYKFEPGADDDGVTCTVPAGALAGLSAGEFAWLVPGLLGEKVALLLRTLPRGTRREIQPVTEAVDKVLPKLRSVYAEAGKNVGLPPLLDALADALWRATGVKTAPGDYRPGDLPPFLNMNFRVVDEKGAVIRAGRDLERLQRECAADARDNFAAAPKGKFERVGLTKWDFDFPAMAPLPGGAVGFPGLKDCGRDVSLLLYDNPEKAERVTRKGLCRLALLEMGAQADRVSRSLPLSRAATLFFGSIKGDAAQLRGAVMDAAARELVRQDRKLPRNRAEFDALLARFKREFYGAAYALGEAVSAALETASRLYAPIMRARPTPAREPSFNDMRAQLAALINPGFVADAGAAYLPRLPRYLQALELRLTKLEANLQRDARRTAEIVPLWDLCVRGFARCRAEKRPVPEALARYRWLLEEYRIVLFAQEVGAFEPASKEKLEALAREFA
ncbi:MAG: ATP-dependent RNA helicase HrpA, partial [Planctomycetes bacterium]|nr:ATP-dependent RNA helicase HrpA [Planctomycetota bacterium]